MLDFYLIKDTTPSLAHGWGEYDYVGGIDLTDFELLQDLKIIEHHQDFYKDFRWHYEDIVIKLDALLTTQVLPDLTKSKFIKILSKAKDTNNGLIAFCD
jgi:hypothetical protein